MIQFPRKSFYFIRHGETDVNADPNSKRVDYDLPLNLKGEQQALDARRVIEKLPLKHVRCSPIQRAQQTKDLILNGFDLDCSDDDRISECPARVWTEMVSLEVDNTIKMSVEVEQFLSRVNKGLSSALEENKDPLLIVSHGGVHWAICYSLSIEEHPWRIGNCEVVLFEPIGETKWKASVIYG